MARPDAADGDTGGVEWTEPLTIDVVGRVPKVAPPGTKGEYPGVLNTAVLTFGTARGVSGIPASEISALASMASIGGESVKRWFGLPGATKGGVTTPRAPRDCVPLKVTGRKQRGFISAERRRRMCTVRYTERDENDDLRDIDKAQRLLDFKRALFAACVCTAKPAPPLQVGGRYYPGTSQGTGGLYRQVPLMGVKDGKGRLKIFEYEPYYTASWADAVEYILECTEWDGGYSLDSGHRLSAAWVRIWLEDGTAQGEPHVVRIRHTYPAKNQVYELESFDIRKEPFGDETPEKK